MNTKSVILAGLLSLISACSNDPAAYRPRTVQSGTPPLPIYVFGSDLALGQTVALHASCAARSATVLCEKPSGTGTSTFIYSSCNYRRYTCVMTDVSLSSFPTPIRLGQRVVSTVGAFLFVGLLGCLIVSS